MRELEQKQDDRDRQAILAVLNMTKRCPGGRLVIDGYVCPHCGADFEEDRRCGKPMASVVAR